MHKELEKSVMSFCFT